MSLGRHEKITITRCFCLSKDSVLAKTRKEISSGGGFGASVPADDPASSNHHRFTAKNGIIDCVARRDLNEMVACGLLT